MAHQSEPPKRSEPEMYFVNITNSSLIDESSRTHVRAHAMREVHRRRKQLQEPFQLAAALSSRAVAGNSPSMQVRRFKLRPQSLQLKPPSNRTKSRPLQSPKPSSQPKHSSKAQHNLPQQNLPLRHVTNIHSGKVERPLSNQRPIEETASIAISIGDERTRRASHTDSMLTDATRLNESPHNVSLHSFHRNWTIDPFTVTSLQIGPRAQQLVYHYFNERLQASCLMLPVRKGFFSLAIHDKAVFYACLSHYAASYNLRFQSGDPVESVQYRAEAIRILNTRLADPIQRIKDGTIGAVASIALYESANGTLPSVEIHINGLAEMVRMRGGFQQAGFPLCLQRQIAWADLNSANALSRRPLFAPLLIPSTRVTSSLQNTQRNELKTHREDHPDRLRSHPDISDILTDLQSLSKALQSIKFMSLIDEDVIKYGDRVYILQRHLHDLLCSTRNIHDETETACARAACIYISSCLRDIGFNFRIIALSVTKLKAVLEELRWDYSFYCSSSTAIATRLLWTVTLGGIAACRKPERPWFVVQFWAICNVRKLSTWDEVHAALTGLPWKSDLDEPGALLWEEKMELESRL